MDAKCPIPLKRVNMRGYFGVGLDNPKNSCNIAAALRACGVYDAGFLATSGKRYKRNSIDTGSSYRHLPYFQVEYLRTIIPYDCIPVAVDIIPEAKNLITFSHPERAFYIFGQEDGTLGDEPPPQENAVFNNASDESDFFAQDATAQGLSGTMDYKDQIVGDDNVLTSQINIDLHGNGIEKRQTMYLAKLILYSLVVPLNSE